MQIYLENPLFLCVQNKQKSKQRSSTSVYLPFLFEGVAFFSRTTTSTAMLCFLQTIFRFDTWNLLIALSKYLLNRWLTHNLFRVMSFRRQNQIMINRSTETLIMVSPMTLHSRDASCSYSPFIKIKQFLVSPFNLSPGETQ